MKRKKAGRKTRKTPPEVKAKPLRPPYTISQIGRTLVLDSVNGGFRRAVPADFAGRRHNFRNLPPHASQVLERTATGEYRPAKRFKPTTMVYGVPLPPDFEEAVEHYAGDVFHGVYGDLESEFDGTKKLEAIHRRLAALIRGGLEAAFRDGFYLALVHHSDDLKHSAKAAPLLEGQVRGRKKGAAANRQKAAPGRAANRKRFRELRKSGFTKTDARKVLEQETRKSFRTIQRHTDGMS